MTSIGFHIRKAVAVAAALGMLSAGQAGAAIRLEDRPATRGSELSIQPSYPDFVDRYVASHTTRSVSPPDFVDRYVARHRTQALRPPQSNSVSQPGEGFDWGAAGVGASTTAVLLLGLGAGIGVARRSRGRSAAA